MAASARYTSYDDLANWFGEENIRKLSQKDNDSRLVDMPRIQSACDFACDWVDEQLRNRCDYEVPISGLPIAIREAATLWAGGWLFRSRQFLFDPKSIQASQMYSASDEARKIMSEIRAGKRDLNTPVMRDIGYGADAARNPGDGQRTIHPQEFTFRRRYTDYTSIKERQDGLL
jgi:phage gp36-like protein